MSETKFDAGFDAKDCQKVIVLDSVSKLITPACWDEEIRLLLVKSRQAHVWQTILPDIAKWKAEWKRLILPWLMQMKNEEFPDTDPDHNKPKTVIHQVSLPGLILRFNIFADNNGGISGKDNVWIINGHQHIQFASNEGSPTGASYDVNMTLIGLRESLGFSVIPYSLWLSVIIGIVQQFNPSTASNKFVVALSNLGFENGQTYPNITPQVCVLKKHYNPRLINPKYLEADNKDTDPDSGDAYVWLKWAITWKPCEIAYTISIKHEYGNINSGLLHLWYDLPRAITVAQMEHVVQLTFDKTSDQKKYKVAIKLIHEGFWINLALKGTGRINCKLANCQNIPFRPKTMIKFDAKETSPTLETLGEEDVVYLFQWFANCGQDNVDLMKYPLRPSATDDVTDLVRPLGTFENTAVPRSLRFRDAVGKELHRSFNQPPVLVDIVFSYIPLLIPNICDNGASEVYPRH